MKLIEYSFPYNEINEIANNESYRKEVFRPIYHTHKWWAIRLGSIFRAITIGACLEKEDTSFVDTYYKRYNCNSKLILISPINKKRHFVNFLGYLHST